MSGAMASYLGKRFLGNQVGNYFKQDDPYFQATQDTPGGKKAKPKKKAIPPGLSEHDAKILKKVRSRAYHMDRAIPCCCCGFRFGWSAVIGIIPGIGDLIDMFIAWSIIRTCMEVGLPRHIVAEMYANMALDFGIGLVPVIGDIADAWFKCNTRNNVLLERYLREKGQKHPVAPSAAKQSTLGRWFRAGPDDSAEQPPVEAHPSATSSAVPVTADPNATANPSVPSSGFKPPLPDRTASAVKAGLAGAGDDRDLEAQNDAAIHYSREG